MGLARHESEFEAASEVALDPDDLLAALGCRGSVGSGNRRDAIARCLSASEGWREASTRLGGAFATLGGATELTDDKE